MFRSGTDRLVRFMTVLAVLAIAIVPLTGCPRQPTTTSTERRPAEAEVVPISVSVLDETAAGQRRLKVRITWSERYQNDPVIHLKYDAFHDATSPPYTHLKPQDVVALSDLVHWEIREKDVQVDTSGQTPAWVFYVPLQQNWPITPPWNGHARVRVSAFFQASDGSWRGAAGKSTTAIVPQQEAPPEE